MSVKNELLTISEFAKAIGKSRQWVYKKLSKDDNELTEYLQIVDNKKYIEKSAIKLYVKSKTVNNDVNGSVNNDSNATEKRQNDDKAFTDTEKEFIVQLQEQLKEKDRQIETLHRLLDQQQQLSLHLQSKIDRLELSEPENPSEEQRGNSEVEPRTNLEESQDEPERKSQKWWKFWGK